MNDRIIFFNQENLYFVNDHRNETLVTVCLKAGCGQELFGQNGIAHLVEHICLSYRHDKFNFSEKIKVYRENGFRFSGYTNYGQTILKYSFPNSMDNIILFLNLLNLIVSSAIISEGNFELSKHEILDECEKKKLHWNWQQEIISFITDHHINELPVGKSTEIEKMQINDAKLFMQSYYTIHEIGIIFFTSLPFHEIINLFHQLLDKKNRHQSCASRVPRMNSKPLRTLKQNQISTCLLKHPSNNKIVELYYQKEYLPVNLKRKLIRMMFELIAKKCIENFVLESIHRNSLINITVSDKHVNYFYFATFTMTFSIANDDLCLFAKEVALFLKELVVTNSDFNQSKNVIYSFLRNPQVSREQLFQNLSSHFFYGEPYHITHEHYLKIVEMVEIINLTDVNDYKEWILRAPCKIVISE